MRVESACSPPFFINRGRLVGLRGPRHTDGRSRARAGHYVGSNRLLCDNLAEDALAQLFGKLLARAHLLDE